MSLVGSGASAVPGMAYGKQQQASGRWRPSPGSSLSDCREESYMLLLELSSQEPTLQACFKIIESTCLARGVGLKVRGRNVQPSFQAFLDRFYLPFAETAIRHFFTLGFVPWRLRRISTGDCVPEVVPLGMFTWSIDSIPNRVQPPRPKRRKEDGEKPLLLPTNGKAGGREREQVAAARAFQHQKEYFGNSRYKPYAIPADDDKKGNNQASASKVKTEEEEQQVGGGEGGEMDPHAKRRKLVHSGNTPAYYRQQEALRRQLFQRNPVDDDETKLLRYVITFTENCGIMEDDVEVYEFMSPTNSVTRSSVLYGSVPSPLAHILVDYRNMRSVPLLSA